LRNPLLNDDSIDDDQQLSQVNSFLLSLSDNDDGESQRVWIWTTRIDKFLLSNKRDQECYDRIRCHANNMWHFGRGMRFATVPSYDTWGREGKAMRKTEFSKLFVFASFGIVRFSKFGNFLEISCLFELAKMFSLKFGMQGLREVVNQSVTWHFLDFFET